MNDDQKFFDFAAEVGLTKHFGGIAGTEELAELCHIDEGAYVLDVGCGVGATACFLAKRYGCRVAGIDILPAMVVKSAERAKRLGLEDRVAFRVADAQSLPFEDGLFDAVITESVTTFPEDKQQAVNEYARVTKPGGWVGLAESTWRKRPIPPEMVEWASQDLGASVGLLTADDWTELLRGAGLQGILVKTYPVRVQNEAKELMRRYGCGGMLGVFGRMAALYIKNPAYRRFVKATQSQGVVPENLDQYFGYGLYAGRNPV